MYLHILELSQAKAAIYIIFAFLELKGQLYFVDFLLCTELRTTYPFFKI